MKNKKIFFAIGGLLFVVGVFILFKAAVWGVYSSCISDIDNLEEIIEGYSNSFDLAVTTKEVNDYLEFNDFKIGNYFEKFKYDEDASTDWSEIYYQYAGAEKIGMFSASTFTPLVEAGKKDDISIYGVGGDEKGISFANLFYSGFEDFIERNNINDDADLIKTLSKYNFNNKYGVFTSLKTLREDYSIKLVASVALPSIDKIYYLNGDLKGYMLEIINDENNRSCYEINIFKNKKRYIFTVLSSDFNLDDMKEIISTIVIE